MSHLVFCFPQTRFGGGRDTHTGGLACIYLLVRAVTGLEGMVGDVASVCGQGFSPKGGLLTVGGQTWSLGFFLFSCVRSYHVERWVVQRGTE